MANFNISVYNGNTCIDTLNIGVAKSRYKDDDYFYFKVSIPNKYGIQYIVQNKKQPSYYDVAGVNNKYLSIKFKIK